jgi:putative oxidoreductase
MSLPNEQPSKALHVALWIAQVLLALAFGMAGAMKTTRPIAELAAQMAWVGRFSPGVVRFIGTMELLAAVGLLLPSVTRVRPVLTPLAAVGLIAIMVLAAGHHLMHGEAKMVPINAVLGALAAFVAWGRFAKAPIPARA